MFEKIKKFFARGNKISSVGSGSTINLKNIINEPLSKDGGFFYIDAKGDSNLNKKILDCMDIKPDSKQNENTFKNQVINYDESDSFFEPDEETKEAYKNRDILKQNMQ